MQFHTMDNMLIDIYNIRNIESIKFYDVVVTKVPKLIIVPALYVIYDGGKEINLCAKDEYFTTFAKKVVQVYEDEKNQILEGSLTDPFHMNQGIQIDEHTQEILSSGVLENINQLYQFYDGKESYEGSLLFQANDVEMLLPIVTYHLMQMLYHTDKAVHFDDEFSGYRDYYMMSGTLDGVPTNYPFMYDKMDDNQYAFTIGGLLGSLNPVHVQIHFTNDRIHIQVSLGNYEILGNFTYLISNSVVKSITDIQKNGVTICYENTDLKVGDNPLLNLANLDRESEFQWFQLPWGAYYGIDSNVTDLSDIEKIVEISNMYLYHHNKTFMRKEYFSKRYHRKSTANVLGQNITLDEAIKNTMGVCLSSQEGIYLIETAFLDTLGVNGYYDEKLKNRYFYHVVKNKKGLKNIHGASMAAISKSDGILDSGDTMNTSYMLKIVRGK